MVKQDSVAVVADADLARDSVSALEVAGVCVSGMGPTAAVALTTPLMAAQVGIAVPFAFLLGTVGVLATGYGVIVLSRRSAGSGIAFSYLRPIFGDRAAFVAGWMHTGAWLTAVTVVHALAAEFLSALLGLHGVGISWLPLFFLLLAVNVALNLLKVRVPVRLQLAVELISVALIAAIMVIVLAKGGLDGFSAKPFWPGPTVGFGAIGLALLYAFTSYAGYEAGAALAREAKDPQRTVARGVALAIGVSGVFFLLCSYAMALGFGVANAGAWADDATPLGTIATQYAGHWAGTLVDVLVTVSAFSIGLTTLSVAPRMTHSLAAAGFLPAWLSRTHRITKSPYGAILLTAAITALIGLAVGVPAGAHDMIGVITTTNTIWWQLAYGAIAVGAAWVFAGKRLSFGARWLRFGVPALSVLLIGYSIYSTVHAIPPFPLSLAPPLAAAWLLIGIVRAIVVRRRGAADPADQVGAQYPGDAPGRGLSR
jgi:amino acid transporter